MAEQTPADVIARAFHETYERIAPTVGYETRRASAVPWDEVPATNRELMVATVKELLADGVVRPRVDADTRTEIEALVERWKEREVSYEAARNYGIVTELDHRDIARNARAAELLSLLLGEVPDGD